MANNPHETGMGTDFCDWPYVHDTSTGRICNRCGRPKQDWPRWLHDDQQTAQETPSETPMDRQQAAPEIRAEVKLVAQ